MNSTRFETFKKLIATPELPDLGPGPRAGVIPIAILTEKIGSLFTSAISRSTQDQLRCAALLWHDHHDAAHALAQDDHTPEGSWFHAILHRREPDYGNSKYWFRQLGTHPQFPPLARAVSSFCDQTGDAVLKDKLVPGGEWDPMAFVNACAGAARLPATDPHVTPLRQIQALEFDQLIFHLLSSTGD